ncbi:MAG: 2OG-Fe(II) oxygenase [Nanoarchaeota archaeon]|nr:2OG-Fe(II) oxygenase [Nanoarchaeota archaeon]
MSSQKSENSNNSTISSLDYFELSYWINPSILEQKDELKELFSNAKPYEHISIQHILKEELAQELEKALFNLNYEEFDTDLYHFFKTPDFKHITNLPPILKEFHEFIFHNNTIKWFEELTSTPLSLNHVGDLHSILLQQTHYLLCHDDQVDQRIIAFIFNLSHDFSKEDGGALEIFGHDNKNQPTLCENTIIPKFNQLNIFKVSEISFHQINEVLAQDKNRLSISGWYYK